jgi:Fe-S cluster assembly protein SufD
MTGITALGLPEARRNEAAALFRARGVPHRRIEDWKYSDLKSALGEGGIGAAVAQWQIRGTV